MNEQYILLLSRELQIAPRQVKATAQLLADGATVPFIARYRKEATGSLDETVITAIRERLAQLEGLDKRRESILKSLQEQGKLTEELQEKILQAETLVLLEDLYLPFRPKRRTRAAIAREKGLEPLAKLLFAQLPTTDPLDQANRWTNPETGVSSPEEALAGARDIMAEWVSEHAGARARLRALVSERGVIRSRVVAGKEAEGLKFRDYYDWVEPLAKVPSHRMLAMRRGEKEGFLTVHIAPPEEDALSILETFLVKGDTAAAQEVRAAVHDAYRRLLAPSLESEARQGTKERADMAAIRVFAENLRHLLMAAPLGSKKIMALDPGFRTGCKLVCLDAQGKLLHSETVYPHSGTQAMAEAAKRIAQLVAEFDIEAIAIGNGTAGKETEAFIRRLTLPERIQTIMVDESGASVYSASRVAREEFPDQDVTVRGAVSIGRRLMDPLAELVKIDAKAIGVGQYQHDVDQGELKKSLDDVVMSCVNAVGVEVNTASPHLLIYVSGLGPQLARNIVAWRNENGPFRSRQDLKKVSRLGPKAFEQAAGFLRIRDGVNPLDASAVHPETYALVENMAWDLNCTVIDLMGDATRRKAIDPARYATDSVGMPTLRDILAELAKPGRDPREVFAAFAFASGIENLGDLKPGMRLPGIVTNVTAFGAFVDIGVHRDGLVHVSELSDQFVKDPASVVRVHQRVNVMVLEVDTERGRISLSMKSKTTVRSELPERKDSPSPKTRSEHKQIPAKKTAFNSPFAAVLTKP